RPAPRVPSTRTAVAARTVFDGRSGLECSCAACRAVAREIALVAEMPMLVVAAVLVLIQDAEHRVELGLHRERVGVTVRRILRTGPRDEVVDRGRELGRGVLGHVQARGRERLLDLQL